MPGNIVQTTSGITGFSADKFTLDTTGLTTPKGTWAVQQSGNNLVLAYTRFNTTPVFASNPLTGGPATEDVAYAATLTATDPDLGVTLVFSKISGPAWLAVAANGNLTGTPPNAQVGLNSFTVRVTDSIGAFSETTLNITVANTNDDPVFAADPINESATEDSAFTGQLAATDVDAGDTLTFSKVTGPAWLTISATGELSGTPANANVGPNAFAVQVTDGTATAQATLNITVTNTNDAPVFSADPISAPGGIQDSPYSAMIAGTADDADAGDTLVYSKVSGPAWLVVSASGALSGTPEFSDVNLQTFTVRATDPAGTFADAVLNITITPLPDANTNGILDNWERAHFPDAAPGSNPAGADPDGDGLSNLMEYALDTDPLVANKSSVVHDMETIGAARYLRLTVDKNPAATNLIYTVETCDALNNWSATHTATEPDPAHPHRLIVRDDPADPNAPRRFIRLKVSVSPP
jgi:VCBS repeat-containing protein